MTRAQRLGTHRTRRNRIAALVSIIALACATGGTIAMAAVSQVTEMTVCVAADGSTSQFNPYEGDCPGSTQEVAWAVHGVAPTTTTTPPTTTAPTTTTKPPVTTTTQGPVGSGKPQAGGYFAIQPPGTPFPSDATCASRVHRSSWEPRPDNTTANHTPPAHLAQLANFGQFNATWNSAYKSRIRGDYAGTTDEIIQYEACRWNMADEWVRAEAVIESTWHQSTVGDLNNSKGSYGLLQIKVDFHPNVNNRCKTCVGTSWPDSQNSTAYNVDQQLAELRGCYDGLEPYLGATRGDFRGCLGSWFSGAWHTSSSETYVGWVTNAFNAKSWLNWSG